RGGQHPTATGCYLNLRCRINGELCQDGNTNDMLIGFERLIAVLSSVWTPRPGDMIYTGTPGGVGPLQLGEVTKRTPNYKTIPHMGDASRSIPC
ncbi:MAG: hypothetical protein GY875_14760, partial [Gammaproteobacteria bacterium]|nr:hypothetical protein [Gammaproteobacteria bacterium]